MSLARKHTGFSFAINLLGKVWVAIFSILFVPKFGSILGAEAYGLATLQAVIMSISTLLDLGLSTGITHRLARVDVSNSAQVKQARNLLRSFEALYFASSVLIFLTIVATAPLVARYWFHLESLTIEDVEKGLRIIGVFALFQFSQTFYAGALTGLYKPDRVNLARCFQVTFQNVGAFLLIRYWVPSVHVFLGWQALIATLTFFVLRSLTWRELPSLDGEKARFEKSHLKENFAYFKGLTAFSFWGIIVGNTDRLIVSKFLPLTQFGFYQLSSTLTNALQYLGQPFNASIFPKLSRLYQEGEKEAAGRFYMRACSMLSTLVIPVGLSIAAFAREVLIVTGTTDDFVTHASPILALLSIGTTLNVLMLPPLALQMSHEWMKLSTYKNMLAAIIFLPLMYVAVRNFGTIGAASCWILLNASYIAIELPLMHRRLLPGKLWLWYRSCLIYPSLLCAVLILPLRAFVLSLDLSRWSLALALSASGTIALLAVAFSQRENRTILMENLSKIPGILRELRSRRIKTESSKVK